MIRSRVDKSEQRILSAETLDLPLDETAAALASPRLNGDILARLASLTQDPSTVLVFRGVLHTVRAEAQMCNSIASDCDVFILHDVLADLRAECATYGIVRQVRAGEGENLFVEFNLLDDAIIAIISVQSRI